MHRLHPVHRRHGQCTAPVHLLHLLHLLHPPGRRQAGAVSASLACSCGVLPKTGEAALYCTSPPHSSLDPNYHYSSSNFPGVFQTEIMAISSGGARGNVDMNVRTFLFQVKCRRLSVNTEVLTERRVCLRISGASARCACAALCRASHPGANV